MRRPAVDLTDTETRLNETVVGTSSVEVASTGELHSADRAFSACLRPDCELQLTAQSSCTGAEIIPRFSQGYVAGVLEDMGTT